MLFPSIDRSSQSTNDDSFQASHQNDAAIILWNTNTWKPIVRLAVHQLTVVRMAFSHDGRYLLSVSRDRSWSLFEIDETSKWTPLLPSPGRMPRSPLDLQARLFKRISTNNPHHKRIIWTCGFTHDDQYFVTGARDQMIHVWRVKDKSADDNEHPCEPNSLKLADSVTAVTCASRFIDEDRFVSASLHSPHRRKTI